MSTKLYIRDRAGRLRVNPAKMFVQHYTLLPDAPNQAVTIAANATSAPLVFTGPQEGPFEGFLLAGRGTSLALGVTFDFRRRNLQNYPIHGQTILGGQVPAATGFLGYVLPETLWLLPKETLVVQLQDLSGQENTVKLAIHGRIYTVGATPAAVKNTPDVLKLANQADQQSTPYFYTTHNPPLSLTALQTQSPSIHVGQDGAFELHKIGSVSTGAFSIQLYDPNSGRKLTSSAVHSDLITGNAYFPFILPEPLFIKRNANINFDITDLTGAPNTIYLTFAGRRICAGDEGL